MTVEDDLQRSRLTVFFRVPLAVPHLVWLVLWGIVAVLRRDRELVHHAHPRAGPRSRCTASSRAYVRYPTHVYAFAEMAANPFPGFTGRPGSYPIDLEIAPPERQNRWITGFRLVLAVPAFLISGALGSVGFIAASSAGSSASSPAGCRAGCETSSRLRSATTPRRSDTSRC